MNSGHRQPFQLTGRPVARVQVRYLSGSTESFVLVAGRQHLPPGTAISTFGGFATVFHALAVASHLQKAGIVVQLRGRPKQLSRPAQYFLGDFHVLEGDKPQAIVRPDFEFFEVVPFDLPAVHQIRYTKLLGSKDKRTWTERVDAARGAQEYIELLRDFIGLDMQELHVAERVEHYKPGVLNFNVALTDASGHAGIVRLPQRKQDALPDPFIAIGRLAFNSTSHTMTAMTLVHEAVHLEHAHRAIELFSLWQRTESDDFQKWVTQLWRKRKISDEEFSTTDESRLGGEAVTQVLAALEGFMAGYHYLELASYKHLEPFHQLTVVADHWQGLRQYPKVVGDNVIRRLVTYYGALNKDHQDALRQYLVAQAKWGGFYAALKSVLEALPVRP